MYGLNPGNMYFGSMPSINPSPFQYPSPSQFGQQGMMQNQPAQTQPQQTGPDWIQVPTAQQVEQVSVQPGGKAWCMIQNAPMFALRVADNLGVTTTDFYRFEKIDHNTALGNAVSPSSQPSGMTRDEVDALISERLSAFADSFKPSTSRSRKGDATE